MRKRGTWALTIIEPFDNFNMNKAEIVRRAMSILGQSRSRKKIKACRENAKKAGRPKGSKNKK